MINLPVCVDANLVLKLVLVEEGSDQAEAIWEKWAGEGVRVIAPPLLWYELTSALRVQVYRNRMTVEESRAALRTSLALNISPVTPTDLHLNAWELATRLGRPNAYDSHYLALAETHGCEFWTADMRLYNAVKGQLPWVRSLQEARV